MQLLARKPVRLRSVAWFVGHLGRWLVAIASLALAGAGVAAEGTWSSEVNADTKGRWLGYKTTAVLLGKPTPVEIQFHCTAKPHPYGKSTLGLQWAILATGPLKPFDFLVFETQPKALANNRLMEITVTRKGQPDLVHKVRAQGVEPSKGFFMFELEAESKLPASVPKEILQALAADGALSVKLTVTDSKDAKRKLEVTVPVAGKQAAFRELVTDLR